MRAAEGGGLKLVWDAVACPPREHRGGPHRRKQVYPGAEAKPAPRTLRGGVSANEACVNKGGKKYPPTEGGGACDRIATGAEAS